MTVMVRLYDKGLLERSAMGESYVYEPTLSQEGLVDEASRRAVRDVLERFGDLAVAHFLKEVHLSPGQLQQLRDWAQGEEGRDDG